MRDALVLWVPATYCLHRDVVVDLLHEMPNLDLPHVAGFIDPALRAHRGTFR